MDQHASHEYIKNCGFGRLGDMDKAILATTPVWGEVKYIELPPHDIPNLDAKIAMHHNHPLYVIPGPNHGQKTFVLWL